MKFLVSFLIFLMLFNSASLAQMGRFSEVKNIAQCASKKGVWREFGNDCADSCELQLQKLPICTAILTYSCDCGEDLCWHENNCISLSAAKIALNDKKNQIENAFKEAQAQRQKDANDAKLNPAFGALFGGKQTRFDYNQKKENSFLPDLSLPTIPSFSAPKTPSVKKEVEVVKEATQSAIDKSKIKIPQQIQEMEKKLKEEVEKQNLTKDSEGPAFPEAPKF